MSWAQDPGQDAKADIQAAAEAPKIDGDVTDGAWTGKEIPGQQVDVYSGKAANIQSVIYMTYDDKNVYIAAVMPEEKIDQVVADAKDRDGQVWDDDALEIFIDPLNGEKGAKYYQIIVNSIGTIYDGQGKKNAWNGNITAAAKVDKEGKKWSVEVQIPLADIGVEGSPKGQTWLANFIRDRQSTGMAENFAWADVGEDAHNWNAFGHVTFK